MASAMLRPGADGYDSVVDSLDRLRSGDHSAATHLWQRYSRRLIGLARKKLGNSSRSSMDEDDVVQDAFSSFCRSAQEGCFPDLADRDSLWALLALITARKAANQRSHLRRAKRGGNQVDDRRAARTSAADLELARVVYLGPSPQDAVLFVNQLEEFMHSLHDPTDRLILLWKLEEHTNPEIARRLDCSLSAIERRLRSIRRRLGQRFTSNQ